MGRPAKRKKSKRGIIIIKKSNDLIESRYKFDIWETRVFLSVLGQIRREDEDFKVYRIWYKDVIKVFGLKSGDSYSYLRDAAKSLMGKSFFVSYEDEGVKREKQYHILREIDYLQEGQQGKKVENQEYIDITVEYKMKSLLLELQRNFTAYDLQNITQLGVYPLRVYELLKQYQSIGNRKLRVDEMKRMFELTDQYKLFGDFFRWVVKPAIKEINKHTDLVITDVEKIKEGRRVVALRFTFHAKKETAINAAENIGVQTELKLSANKSKKAEPILLKIKPTEKDQLFSEFQEDVVQRFGVTPSVFMQLLDNHARAEIEQAIRVTNRAKYNQQIKSSIAGFFIQALRNGYTDQKEEARKKKAKKEAEAKAAQREYERNKKINEIIRELTIEDPNLTLRAIEGLNENTAAKMLIHQKENELGRDLEVDDFREDVILRSLVKEKIMELKSNYFKEI